MRVNRLITKVNQYWFSALGCSPLGTCVSGVVTLSSSVFIYIDVFGMRHEEKIAVSFCVFVFKSLRPITPPQQQTYSSSDEEEEEEEEEDELDMIPSEIYCPWTPARSPVEMTSPCRKSKSTGSSSSTSAWSRRRWKIRNLLKRSRSDGKESLEFLNSSPVNNIDKSCSSSPCPKNKETVKTKKKEKEKEKEKVSAHEKFYLRNKAMKEEDKRKSYLPYKQELVGIFSNIHRHGKAFPRF
ncbi:ribosome biogenesis protein NOP53 [Raphanus sativus]|uniref:Ribosome biogenesis protein NOP53 n=1 Tax=Raphanus sativus TaxID=3726 RepID=A0A6J0JRR7_RAPSA|nr:ribosome biogenesis protein NOP53 [Raphanus sativus]